MGCRPWGRKESDTTERLHCHFSLSCTGEGNGTPVQCSHLENPRDGGAWGAAVCGVAQSRTRLERLSSSSSSYFPRHRTPSRMVHEGCDSHSKRNPGLPRHLWRGKKRATTQTSLDHFPKRVDRIESSKEPEPVPTLDLSGCNRSAPSVSYCRRP